MAASGLSLVIKPNLHGQRTHGKLGQRFRSVYGFRGNGRI